MPPPPIPHLARLRRAGRGSRAGVEEEKALAARAPLRSHSAQMRPPAARLGPRLGAIPAESLAARGLAAVAAAEGWGSPQAAPPPSRDLWGRLWSCARLCPCGAGLARCPRTEGRPHIPTSPQAPTTLLRGGRPAQQPTAAQATTRQPSPICRMNHRPPSEQTATM
jgi:hypothetical protein